MTSQIGRSNVSYVITFNYEHKCSNHLIACIMFRQISRINVSYVIMFRYEYKCSNQRIFCITFICICISVTMLKYIQSHQWHVLHFDASCRDVSKQAGHAHCEYNPHNHC